MGVVKAHTRGLVGEGFLIWRFCYDVSPHCAFVEITVDTEQHGEANSAQGGMGTVLGNLGPILGMLNCI